MSPPSPTPVAVLASGRGSNLQALLDAQARGALHPAQVVLVIANQPGAQALDRAAAAGVPTCLIPHRDFGGGEAGRAAFEDALLAALRERAVQVVALAGFMRLLSARFLQHFPDRVVNIHPSLLPAFPGVHAQRQALDYGARVTGCTAHLVDEGCDTGPVLLQAAVPILPEDDEAQLAARILTEEHRLFPQAVRLVAAGRVRRQGRRALVLSEPPPTEEPPQR